MMKTPLAEQLNSSKQKGQRCQHPTAFHVCVWHAAPLLLLLLMLLLLLLWSARIHAGQMPSMSTSSPSCSCADVAAGDCAVPPADHKEDVHPSLQHDKRSLSNIRSLMLFLTRTYKNTQL